MLGRLAASCWLGPLLSRQQVLCVSALNSRELSITDSLSVLLHDSNALQQQSSMYHTSSSSATSEQPPQHSSGQPSQAVSASANVNASDSAESRADSDSSVNSAAKHNQKQAETASQGFATLPPRSTSTGYAETVLVDEISGFDGEQSQPGVVPSLPEEKLRIQLRQEVKQQEEAVQIDAYTLSRSLVGGIDTGPSSSKSAAAAGPQQQQQQLTAADTAILEKLVGIMTKDGKKSRARRQLLDAMHIIKQQLAQGKTTA